MGCTNVLLIALVSPPCDVAGDFPLAQKCLNTTMLDTVDTESVYNTGSIVNVSVGNNSTISVKMLFPETFHLWRESRLQAYPSSPDNLGQSRNQPSNVNPRNQIFFLPCTT